MNAIVFHQGLLIQISANTLWSEPPFYWSKSSPYNPPLQFSLQSWLKVVMCVMMWCRFFTWALWTHVQPQPQVLSPSPCFSLSVSVSWVLCSQTSFWAVHQTAATSVRVNACECVLVHRILTDIATCPFAIRNVLVSCLSCMSTYLKLLHLWVRTLGMSPPKLQSCLTSHPLFILSPWYITQVNVYNSFD